MSAKEDEPLDESDESDEEQQQQQRRPAAPKPSASGELPTVCGPIGIFEAIPENIPLHPSILAAGKRRTGKSTSLDNLMIRTMQHIPFGIVMTETSVNGFWQRRVPPRFVFQGWREDILLELIDRQKRMINKYGKKDPRTFAFIILDDVIADQRAIRWSKNINSFFVEGRHINITVLITTQNMKGIGPMVRGNMDIIFIQPIYNRNEREVLYDLYGGFLEKKVFMQLLDDIVIAEEQPGHTAQDPRIKMRIMVVQDWRQTTDCAKKFKYWNPVHSDELPEYKLCAPVYWKKQRDTVEAGKGPRKEPARYIDTLDELLSHFKE